MFDLMNNINVVFAKIFQSGRIYPLHCISIGTEEHSKQQYEVLVSDVNAKYQWVRSSLGQVPQRAIQG